VLFRELSFALEDGARLGLIGPNGSGKTTLLETLAGREPPDSGDVALRRGAKLAYAPQESVFAPDKTAKQIVLAALKDSSLNEHEREVQAGIALGKAGFSDLDQPAGSLSGGWRKRLAIAAELVGEPDVLLLDEPTNHLDLDGVAWLESLLGSESFACIFVSHDRYFLENVARETAEVSPAYPCGFFRVSGAYSTFLEKRSEALAAQSKQREKLENKVQREIAWLRSGPKARTGKSRSRIQRAWAAIDDLSEVVARQKAGRAGIDFDSSGRKTKRLLVAQGVGKSLAGKQLFGGLDFQLSPGVRMGVVGPNGSGKTTLLNLIRGALDPDDGEIRRAEGLRVVTLDQERSALLEDASLERALCPDGDAVLYRGRSLHVAAWAKRFLFRTEQLALPISRLSGGERARVAVARLMLEEADLLALDEPTNDLDIDTLEVLEENLEDFPGAMALVTHDRHLLDRVTNVVVGIDGDGAAALYGDYEQWLRARAERRKTASNGASRPRVDRSAGRAVKLSYHEQREWETMEAEIEKAEARLEKLNTELQQVEPERMAAHYEGMEHAREQVERLYARWEELEAKRTPSSS